MTKEINDFYEKNWSWVNEEATIYKLEKVATYLKGIVVDAGCGSGQAVKWLYDRNFDVFGIDISTNAIKNCRKKYPQCDFYEHDLIDESLYGTFEIDSIICFDVIEHIFNYHDFLDNINKSLKSNGTFVIGTMNIYGLMYWLKMIFRIDVFYNEREQSGHINFFTESSLKNLLEEHGFKVEKIIGYSKTFNYLPAFLSGNFIFICKKAEGEKK